MNLKIKPFEALSKRELYEILRLYVEVIGCVRIFRKPDEPGTVQVDRLAAKDRLTGLGRRLIEKAREEAKKQLGGSICI